MRNSFLTVDDCVKVSARSLLSSVLVMLFLGWTAPLSAHNDLNGTGGGSADELAQQLANPIANLISVPLQSNFDFGSGPEEDGFRYTLNVQPVIPVDLDEEWLLITRAILPLIYQNDEASSLTDDYDSFFVDRPDINATFLQPFLSYGLGKGWSVGANLEATYDWEGDQWIVPAFLNASKVFSIGGQKMASRQGRATTSKCRTMDPSGASAST